MIPSGMEMDTSCNFIDQIFTCEEERWLSAVVQMKNIVIGNNKQKSQMMTLGVVPRLLQFMVEESSSDELQVECAVVLGSFAKGTDENIRDLIDAGCISVLLKGITSADLKYVEACLRALRTIFTSSSAPIDLIYQDPVLIPHMINICSKSACIQECVTSILAHCCKSLEHQAVLCSNGAIVALAPLLISNIYKVQMPTLKCFAAMCYQNQQVSLGVATATFMEELIPSILVKLLRRDKPIEMQMWAAKCLTYMCRAGAIDAADQIIALKTLPTLVRMCKKDKTWEERVDGAETLACLIEVDLNLQRIAAISDHIIPTLADYFRYPGSPPDSTLMPKNKDEISVGNELRSAAFRAYASLGANDEEIRKKKKVPTATLR